MSSSINFTLQKRYARIRDRSSLGAFNHLAIAQTLPAHRGNTVCHTSENQ